MANSKKQFVVQHSMLGVINPKSGEAHHSKGDTVHADLLGDKANIDRLLEIGAISPKELSDDELAAELEELALGRSREVDLDPAASPLAPDAPEPPKGKK